MEQQEMINQKIYHKEMEDNYWLSKMNDSLAALLTIIFAVIPGILGNRIYELIVDSKKEDKLLNLIT